MEAHRPDLIGGRASQRVGARPEDVSIPRAYRFERFSQTIERQADVGFLIAERELRAIAVGRRNWTFAGSDEGGRRAAAIYTLIATAKLNDIDPQAWLADVLARINDHNVQRLDQLLPWNWNTAPTKLAA